MEEKRWILICANEYNIEEPEFFDTYENAYKEMKRQHEFFSKNEFIGGLNDDNAWCRLDDLWYNWKIFYIEYNDNFMR